MAKIEKRPLLSYGFMGERRLSRFVLGIVGGVAAFSALVLALKLSGFLIFDGQMLHGKSAWSYGLQWGVVFLLTAWFEESPLRGYLQSTWARGIGFWWAATGLRHYTQHQSLLPPPAPSFTDRVRLASRQVRGLPRKRTLVQLNDRSVPVVSENNADYIEPAHRRTVGSQSPHVTAGNRADVLLLGRVDSGLRRHQPSLGVGLDLHEAENTFVPTNHVDFAMVVWRAEVPRHNAVPQASKVKVGFGFTPTRGLQMFGRGPAQVAGSFAEGAGDKSREPDHKLFKNGTGAANTLSVLLTRRCDRNHTFQVAANRPDRV